MLSRKLKALTRTRIHSTVARPPTRDWGQTVSPDTTKHQARCDESLDGQPWSPRQVAEIVDQADVSPAAWLPPGFPTASPGVRSGRRDQFGGTAPEQVIQ
ncbi:MAG: hypothetical protein Ct9H300mP1_30590 [Planctomycetaceae bacterium]|nr:MAG: hypothetical protein Ct9H300mP1_30590 [Planctomycetaceae bacterium]